MTELEIMRMLLDKRAHPNKYKKQVISQTKPATKFSCWFATYEKGTRKWDHNAEIWLIAQVPGTHGYSYISVCRGCLPKNGEKQGDGWQLKMEPWRADYLWKEGDEWGATWAES